MKYRVLKFVDALRLFVSLHLITPARFIFLAYFIITAIGFLLLSQPFSIVPGKVLSLIDILFIAVSALTVTGLATIDVPASFTIFGQFVILVLIQIGGLGYMALATLTALMIGKKIGLRERLVLQAELSQLNIGGIVKFLKTVAIIYFTVEMIGFIFLMFSFVPKLGWKRGAFDAFFVSVSAFNSAGFSPFSDSLMSYKADSIVNLTVIFLIVIGGLGAIVLYELKTYFGFMLDRIKNRRINLDNINFNVFLLKPKFSLHTKIVLWTTLFIYIVCFIVILSLEPGIREGGWWQQFLEGTFAVVNARSGGFNTLDLNTLSSFAIMMMIFLMFVGVGTASTGGGIRVTTFVVMVASCWSVIRGYTRVEIWKRTIDNTIVLRAFAIFFLSLLWISMATFLLLVTNKVAPIAGAFEVVSAFGTVGLSLGITSGLDNAGKLVLCATMLFGRIGVLTFFIALLQPIYARPDFVYPKERVVVGG